MRAGLQLLSGSADLGQPDLPARPVRTALVNVPFVVTDRPSIQCGLLKAVLARAGHTVDVFYLNLELAAELGAELCDGIAMFRTCLLGEWLFSVAAFGYRPDEVAYREACPDVEQACRELGLSFEELCRLRNELLPQMVMRWAEAIDWGDYAAIGFTSTFQQNVAAIALARAIKERYPEATTIFGGANFDGEMGPEYVRAFPWIDYAVIAEGDVALPALIGRISHGLSGVGLPGVVGRRNGVVVAGGEAPRVLEMDGLPDPDYDEYFATLFRLGHARVLRQGQYPRMLFETARGCWWGQKHHCTFCGLNTHGMAFRAKSPGRVIAELRRLADRYKLLNFEAVDNIMDMRYLEGLCQPLSEERYDYTVFFEVKANLTPDQLRRMAQAGIRSIQPGIESLSTHSLELMRKGTTMLQNVRLLKWAHYYGMRVGWNLLLGFPGEKSEDYDTQRRLIPLLWHLQPPGGHGPIWLERFSPYFTDAAFPVRDVEPWPDYRFIYPEEQVDLCKIAYFFDCRMGDTLAFEEYGPLRAALDDWQSRWRGTLQPSLVYQRAPDWVQVIDRRDPAAPQARALHGAEAAAYEYCGETDRTPEQVAGFLSAHDGTQLDVGSVEEILRRHCEMGIMIEERRHFLNLALPANRHW